MLIRLRALTHTHTRTRADTHTHTHMHTQKCSNRQVYQKRRWFVCFMPCHTSVQWYLWNITCQRKESLSWVKILIWSWLAVPVPGLFSNSLHTRISHADRCTHKHARTYLRMWSHFSARQREYWRSNVMVMSEMEPSFKLLDAIGVRNTTFLDLYLLSIWKPRWGRWGNLCIYISKHLLCHNETLRLATSPELS